MLNEAVGAGRQAFEDAVALEHPATLVNASFAFAQALWYAGEFRRAEKLLVDRLREVRGELRVANTGTTGTVSVLHLVCLSKTYAITGQLEKAFATIAEAQQIAEETGKPFDQSYARVGKGFCHLMNEEGLAAVTELEEALRLARAGDIALLIPSSMRYLGPAYALTGRLVDANDLLHEAIERTTAHGLLGMRIWSNAALAEVQLLSAATAKCRETALSTLELAKQHSFRPVQARLSRVLGRLHEKSNDDVEAEQSYRAAVLLSDELDMRPNSHAARRELAILLHRNGRGGEASGQQGPPCIQEAALGG
jgi:tetratricopeptide (TPR) repeat protein